MAHVETEPQDPLTAPEGRTAPASVAVIEENLATLLRAVTAPADVTPADVSPAPAAPVQALHPSEVTLNASSPSVSTNDVPPAEQASRAEGSITIESPAAADLLKLSPPSAQQDALPEASPASLREITPVAESPQEVVSKLALLSSIKQRRAVTIRPDFGAAAESESATAPAATPETAAVPPDAALASHVEQSTEQVSERTVSPAEKIRPKNTPVQSPVPQPEPYQSRASSTLFAPVGEIPSGKPKSFAASAPGIAMIGGTILALGLIAYVLLGHETKPAVAAPQPAATASAPTTPASTPVPATASASPAAPEKPPALTPVAPNPITNRNPATNKEAQPTPKTDATQNAKPAAAPATPNPQLADTHPAPAARAFAPPVPGTRPPADATIGDAPPAISTTTTSLPSVAALPTSLAPPPGPAASKASAPREINVAGSVQAAKLLKSVNPDYPPLARSTRVQGIVRFRVTIATDGRVRGLLLLSGPPPLIQAAANAVKQWRYQPTLVNGEAVEVVTEIELSFRL